MAGHHRTSSHAGHVGRGDISSLEAQRYHASVQEVNVFESCALKIMRAHEHLTALKGHVSAFLAEEPYALEYARGEQPDHWRLIIREPKTPEPKLGIIAGEVAHQLRS